MSSTHVVSALGSGYGGPPATVLKPTPMSWAETMTSFFGVQDIIDPNILQMPLGMRANMTWDEVSQKYANRHIVGLSHLITANMMNTLDGAEALTALGVTLVLSYEERWRTVFRDVVLLEWAQTSATGIPSSTTFYQFSDEGATTERGCTFQAPNKTLVDPNFGEQVILHEMYAATITLQYTFQKTVSVGLAMQDYYNFFKEITEIHRRRFYFEDYYNHATKYYCLGVLDPKALMNKMGAIMHTKPRMLNTLGVASGTEGMLTDVATDERQFPARIRDETDTLSQLGLNLESLRVAPAGFARIGGGVSKETMILKFPNFRSHAFSDDSQTHQPLRRTIVLAASYPFPTVDVEAEVGAVDPRNLAVVVMNQMRDSATWKVYHLSDVILQTRAGYIFKSRDSNEPSKETEALIKKMNKERSSGYYRKENFDNPTSYNTPLNPPPDLMRLNNVDEVKGFRDLIQFLTTEESNYGGHRVTFALAKTIGQTLESQIPTKYLWNYAKAVAQKMHGVNFERDEIKTRDLDAQRAKIESMREELEREAKRLDEEKKAARAQALKEQREKAEAEAKAKQEEEDRKKAEKEFAYSSDDIKEMIEKIATPISNLGSAIAVYLFSHADDEREKKVVAAIKDKTILKDTANVVSTLANSDVDIEKDLTAVAESMKEATDTVIKEYKTLMQLMQGKESDAFEKIFAAVPETKILSKTHYNLLLRILNWKLGPKKEDLLKVAVRDSLYDTITGELDTFGAALKPELKLTQAFKAQALPRITALQRLVSEQPDAGLQIVTELKRRVDSVGGDVGKATYHAQHLLAKLESFAGIGESHARASVPLPRLNKEDIDRVLKSVPKPSHLAKASRAGEDIETTTIDFSAPFSFPAPSSTTTSSPQTSFSFGAASPKGARFGHFDIVYEKDNEAIATDDRAFEETLEDGDIHESRRAQLGELLRMERESAGFSLIIRELIILLKMKLTPMTIAGLARKGLALMGGHLQRWAIRQTMVSWIAWERETTCELMVSPVRTTLSIRALQEMTDFMSKLNIGLRFPNPRGVVELPALFPYEFNGGMNGRIVESVQEIRDLMKGEYVSGRKASSDLIYVAGPITETLVSYPMNSFGDVHKKRSSTGRVEDRLQTKVTGLHMLRQFIGDAALKNAKAKIMSQVARFDGILAQLYYCPVIQAGPVYHRSDALSDYVKFLPGTGPLSHVQFANHLHVAKIMNGDIRPFPQEMPTRPNV